MNDLVPERCSKLPTVARCPGFSALQSAFDDGTRGSAADTGSAHHRLVDLHHQGTLPVDALEIVRSELAQWPKADLEQAEEWAVAYRADPRNGPGSVVQTELVVRCALKPDRDDPTGQPVLLTGHVDQLRRGPDGGLYVWDVKTGKGAGPAMVYQYAWQLAAYAVAASQTLGEEVWCGGVIRTRGYKTRKTYAPGQEPVFFEAGWTLSQCEQILTSATYLIGRLRAGEVLLTPGEHCAWCPGGGPANCATALNALE